MQTLGTDVATHADADAGANADVDTGTDMFDKLRVNLSVSEPICFCIVHGVLPGSQFYPTCGCPLAGLHTGSCSDASGTC
mgnify:CR=1 FL=1